MKCINCPLCISDEYEMFCSITGELMEECSSCKRSKRYVDKKEVQEKYLEGHRKDQEEIISQMGDFADFVSKEKIKC